MGPCSGWRIIVSLPPKYEYQLEIMEFRRALETEAIRCEGLLRDEQAPAR